MQNIKEEQKMNYLNKVTETTLKNEIFLDERERLKDQKKILVHNSLHHKE
jgi:hypothetical protein